MNIQTIRQDFPSLSREVIWLGLILFLFSLLANIYQFTHYKFTDQGILVLEVLDGDTLLLDGKTRLRLRQVDAPELEFCLGQEARDFLASLVKGKKIIIQEKILDQKGRAMALVYLGKDLVNLPVIKNGFGRYHHDQSSKTDVLKAAGQYAKENRLGVYSPQCYQQEKNLDNPDCLIKGNIDVNNKNIKRYYFPGCAQYDFAIVEKDKGEQWFCSEQEARAAGYTKSKTCFNKKFQPPID